jgi:Ca-activated chloride channel family protein
MSAEVITGRRAALTLLLCVLGGIALIGQTARFRARIDIIEVTVSVTDGTGRLITGLTKDDFQIFEDGVEQTITQFTDQRVPVSVGLLLDASDSMRGQPVVDAQLAVDRFVGDLLLPADEVFVATFNHRPRLASKWTTPPTVLQHVLADLKPSGGTAIYDALAETSKMFEKRMHVRAAAVVISDGADTASDRSLYQALEVIRHSDAFVYALAIDAPEARASTRVNPETLREITGMTGGYTEVVRSAADLGPATARIAEELNKQYALGFSSTRPPDGKWRPLRVRVRGGEYMTRARRGYFAEALTRN